MKKKIMTISLSIILVIGLLMIITRSNKKVYTDINGIRYAITVNGNSATSFPSGNYKVDVDCTNADAYWNSITNELIVKNIKGNITCDIEFTSITNNDYLNTYITSLSGTTQGDGQLVHEIGSLPNYTNATVLKSYSTTPVYFRNTSSSSIGQTETNDFWTLDSSTGVFTSNPSKMTTSGLSAYYHAYAEVPEAGYYRICYTIAQSTSSSNQLYIVKNSDNVIFNTSSSSTSSIEECYDIGYFETIDYINISERGYSGTSSPVITFRLEISDGFDSINTGYRYEGENPDNYVMYNNDLWRVLGVFSTEFDSNNDGTADTLANLVKIIREEPIGNLAWDKSNTNDWPNSSLYHLLNYEYYDWNTNKGTVSTYCYGYSTTTPAKCDYSIKGIQEGYRNMIVKAKWYLGGAGKNGYGAYTPDSVYSHERDDNVTYSGRSASTTGYIGLMYESDYLYGVLRTNCSRTTVHDSYSNTDCSGKNWLYGKGYELMLSPKYDGNNEVWSLSYRGDMVSHFANYGYGVRPTLYLSPNVYRVSGTGTITDPYIIGMAS